MYACGYYGGSYGGPEWCKVDYTLMVVLRVLSVIVLFVMPLLIIRFRNSRFRIGFWILWYSAIIFLELVYAHLFSDNYWDWARDGFVPSGNPMDKWMIMMGILSVIPFIFAAWKGTIEKPLRLALSTCFGLLLLIGTPILNYVASFIYLRGGGSWDSGGEFYNGEAMFATNGQLWNFANEVGMILCYLIPVLISLSIWIVAKRSSSSEKKIEQNQEIE